MAKDTIGEFFREGDYYLVKRIREVTGQMAGSGFGPETEYMITLYDSSKGRLEYFDTDDDGAEAVGLAFDDGDIVTIPPNTIASGLEMSDQAANFPSVAVVGLSRLNSQINAGDETSVTPGAAWENITFYHYSFGTSDQYTMVSRKGGTSYIYNCTLWNLHDTGSGNGDIYVVRAYDSGAGAGIVNLYNCKIIADNDTSGLGKAARATDGSTINFFNCHLQVKDEDAPFTVDATSTVNLFGCFVEEI